MLLGELVNGAAKDGGYMLNGGDEGLLTSLEKISAAEASALTVTGSSIAAHTDHLRYGLSLMNRWSNGREPVCGRELGGELAENRGVRRRVAAAARRPARRDLGVARRRGPAARG